MGPMRRGLIHALAWSLATGAAVTLSWWGVHTVMADTAYDRPRALPITTDGGGTKQAAPPKSAPKPGASATPGPSAPSKPSASSGTTGSSNPAAPSATSRAVPSPAAPDDPPGNVKSYTVEGGRVAYDIGPASAELVSATPSGGWTMQIWKQSTYIRVTFSQNGREIDVFCTWHDTAPRVTIEER
ncbi:hypothetical protein [Streptomyces sp. NPDC059828]|uniref:hypothetical protein n=1 Tax=Streptomyces sp. NPDC059828 TaxID=3346965 RepID=UPI00365CDCF4